MSLKVVSDQNQTSPEQRLPIVAIDGPAGAGKSTAARLLAYKLGFTLVDTGALYRSLALQALEKGISLSDEKALAELCGTLTFQFGSLDRPSHSQDFEPETEIKTPKLHVYCNGIDVTDSIRTPELGMAASNISKLSAVREALLQVQRNFGSDGGIVMEGRDIGTVIFPQAEIKFYLTASVESRAKRRWTELKAAGIEIPLDHVARETQARDEQDMNRTFSPLKQAPDSVLVDSSHKSLSEVVNEMFHTVRKFLTL